MSQQLFKRNLIFLNTCELENSSWITILIFTFRETHGRGREFNLNWILFLLKLLGKKIQTKINSFPCFFLFSEKKIQTELYFLPFFWISSITGFSFSISPFTLFHFMFSPSIFFYFSFTYNYCLGWKLGPRPLPSLPGKILILEIIF